MSLSDPHVGERFQDANGDRYTIAARIGPSVRWLWQHRDRSKVVVEGRTAGLAVWKIVCRQVGMTEFVPEPVEPEKFLKVVL